jgi:catechol 2,3-dioxygenase-like lactoylglutathione lyase family enzyme
MPTLLSFVTLRCKDLDRSCAFFETLGLTSSLIRHKDGSHHFDCKAGEQTIELYPRRRGDTHELRLGFQVNNLGDVLQDLRAQGMEVLQTLGAPVVRYAVVKDPDGHTVELRG